MKVQKISKGEYKTCCGFVIEYIDASTWCLSGAAGWYYTLPNGEFPANKSETFRDVKKFLASYYCKCAA
jgi:hypothetical protein